MASLDDKLNEFGRLAVSSHRSEDTFEKLDAPANNWSQRTMRNVNPNQFALPGMEHDSHPGAPFLAKGLMFHHEESIGPEIQSPAQIKAGAPSRINHTHSLYAHNMGGKFNPDEHIGNVNAELHWAGQHDETHNYPGEIKWVSRGYSNERHKGVVSSLYHLGHQSNFGQGTVPIHSPERTPEGEAWSAKVGGPRPGRGSTGWRPPAGIHPFERAGSPPQLQSHVQGQKRLPGMSAASGLQERPTVRR